MSTALPNMETFDLRDSLDLVTRAKRELKGQVKALLPSKKRRVQNEYSILSYCRTTPARSILAMFRRLEQALSSERWPQLAELNNLLALPTQSPRLREYSKPAQRVVAAALQPAYLNAQLSRIRNIMIVDVLDIYINDSCSVQTGLQAALKHLPANLHSGHLKSLKNWRKAGAWLTDFFHRAPLGAICMMDEQTSLWGNVIGTRYIDPIVRYCQSLPGFIAHAQKLTPAACQAIRDWASGCGYDLMPDSSLGLLVQKQEKGRALMDTVEPRPHALSNLETRPEFPYYTTEEVVEPNTVVTMDDVALEGRHCTFNQAFASKAKICVGLDARETSSPALEGKGAEITSSILSPTGRTIERRAASGEELLLSPSPTTLTPMTLLKGVRAGTRLVDKANPFRLSRSPSPPQALLISEHLLRDIKVYFEDCCRKMVFDENEILLSPDGAEFRNDLCTDFDSYCFTATMLKEKGLHVEFGCALSKASALVRDILRAEHPRTLTCFFEVFLHFIQTKLPELAFALLGFVKDMSAEVNGKGNPLSQICWLLAELDPASLAPVMAQAWRCTTDTLDGVLGTTHRLAVSVHLDYAKRVTTDHSEEERLLRDRLAQFGGNPKPPPQRLMLNLTHNLNRQERHDEAEEAALKLLIVLQNAQRIEPLKALPRSQFSQGKTAEAEKAMREAIQIVVEHWGPQHPWVPEFMIVLEGWLRHWGKEEDANTLRGEIGDLMGQDVIDK
ncbi:hypothetical protein LTR09_012917 [Extremus antarcticus]|uniref:Uncharacterized protein n=1 Tax=Extremus antarcticus TaxID=702011 RepID=A0AAJ0D4D8_9PEZI|nr:hypothetical protein LTR09_012917 [Extremus antarcticus]